MGEGRGVLYNVRSAILGLAVADALGVPVEFRSRKTLSLDPVKGMRGYGTHCQPPGTWSDDTSMTVAALDAIVENGLDHGKIMDNFVAWLERGEYTATGVTFDVGNACAEAIGRYRDCGKKPLECGGRDEYSNGNGSLMRILPFVLYGAYGGFEGDYLSMISEASSLTHAHPRSIVGCGIYAVIAGALLRAPHKESIRQAVRVCRQLYRAHPESEQYSRILNEKLEGLTADEIESSGYVVHTLEAALWCVMSTDSYRDCALRAVNLGDDTDTVAAVAGGLAGILYGCDGIPAEWLGELGRRDYLETICERAADAWK